MIDKDNAEWVADVLPDPVKVTLQGGEELIVSEQVAEILAEKGYLAQQAEMQRHQARHPGGVG